MFQKSNWLKNAIIYQIFIDRFSGVSDYQNKPDFLGGNIKGIIQKIDYLETLGINTIWLSPFYQTKAYHGYHITDFKMIDEHYGTLEDLTTLIELAHSKSIRVIADFVPNHCSVKHPFFESAQKDKKSKFYNWFYFKKWPYDYICFLKYKQLPKLNLDNPETRDYMIDAAKYWLLLGIDGFRIDHIVGPSHNFWKCFYSAIKKDFPDCALFGEAWKLGLKSKYFETINFKHKFWRRIFPISQEKLQLEYYGEMDGVLDFKFNEIIIEAAKRGVSFTSNSVFQNKITNHFKKYPKDFKLILFLDNHDMNRFLMYCDGNIDVLLEAIEFTLSLDQPMALYYGTETGMYNKTTIFNDQENSDVFVREPFDWSNVNVELYDKIRNLINKYKTI